MTKSQSIPRPANEALVRHLCQAGVIMPQPTAVMVDDTVDPAAIAPGTVIHPGCRISGARTLIGPECVLGQDGPVVLADCQLAGRVHLGGGSFQGATFLEGVSFGPGAHVRPGTLMEEQASAAHSVGLKHTILMPFVTLGSLINFCDCLMAGGTSRANHSEVGSSFVHFNYTPHQDKATASLIGDAPRGVMLDQPPIFLGGQGGLVGPVCIAYGTVTAAGSICRGDVLETGKLVFPRAAKTGGSRDFIPGLYTDLDRVVSLNLRYIGNLHALREWYRQVRPLLGRGTSFAEGCRSAAIDQLSSGIAERVHRLAQIAERLPEAVQRIRQQGHDAVSEAALDRQLEFAQGWEDLARRLDDSCTLEGDLRRRDQFLAGVRDERAGDYIASIQALSPEARRGGVAWLDSIVESIVQLRPVA